MFSLPQAAIPRPVTATISDLFLSCRHKKQNFHAAIFIKFSIDASSITFNSVVNCTPLKTCSNRQPRWRRLPFICHPQADPGRSDSGRCAAGQRGTPPAGNRKISPSGTGETGVTASVSANLGGGKAGSEGRGDEHQGTAHQSRLLRHTTPTKGRAIQPAGVGELRCLFV